MLSDRNPPVVVNKNRLCMFIKKTVIIIYLFRYNIARNVESNVMIIIFFFHYYLPVRLSRRHDVV